MEDSRAGFQGQSKSETGETFDGVDDSLDRSLRFPAEQDAKRTGEGDSEGGRVTARKAFVQSHGCGRESEGERRDFLLAGAKVCRSGSVGEPFRDKYRNPRQASYVGYFHADLAASIEFTCNCRRNERTSIELGQQVKEACLMQILERGGIADCFRHARGRGEALLR